MTGRPRGGPGDFGARSARSQFLLEQTPSAAEPLAILVDVLRHQRRRAATPQVSAGVERLVTEEPQHRLHHDFPLLDPSDSVGSIAAEVEWAVEALDRDVLPAKLRGSGNELRGLAADARVSVVASWLDDTEEVAPPAAFWCRVAAGPVLELAAASVSPIPEGRFGRHCPVCGGAAQVSVIAEESGEFLGGAPRSLVCARCSTWWPFPRATCPQCGQQDPRRVSGFVERENRTVRIDGCEACHSYVKTFDLREPDTRDVVPLVDDVATLSLDLWAQEQGLHRTGRSFAGV